jgi:hypothetical protein
VAGGVEVTLGWVLEMASEQAGDSGDVRASAHAKPVETANHGLVGGDKGGFGLWKKAVVGKAVDYQATPIRTANRVEAIGGIHVVLGEHFVDMTFLGHVNSKATVGCAAPFVKDTEVKGEVTHKVNVKTVTKSSLKPFLGGVIGTKVSAVVHVSAEVDSATCGGFADEHARVVGAPFQADVLEDSAESLVPVTGRAAEAVEGLL